MLRLVGRKADGWLPSLGVLDRDELRAGNERIDAAAEKAGRDPGSIRRIINVQGLIGDGPAPARSELPVGYLAGGRWPGRPVVGRDDRRASRPTASTRSCSGRSTRRPRRSSSSPET